MDNWSLQDAKNKLSEVVDRAVTSKQAQLITRRGKNTAVVISYEEYVRISRPDCSLLQGLLPDEPIGVDLDIQRTCESGRETGL